MKVKGEDKVNVCNNDPDCIFNFSNIGNHKCVPEILAKF